MNDRQSRGQAGEAAVAQWLEKAGYRIQARNFKTMLGEIDLIARKGDVVAFVEVKARQTEYFALSEVITPTKQKRICAAARAYCARHGSMSAAYRFDVALVQQEGNTWRVTYIEQAFTPNWERVDE